MLYCPLSKLGGNTMISLKQVRDHVNDIESFECPIQDIIDNLYIGPQGELIEAIDLFNFRY